jgi:nucleoid-associated protein YgaU
VRPHEGAPGPTVRLHTVVAGERIDHLAARYYGDPLKFWLICDANDALFPEDLMVPGRVLKIPSNQVT